MHGKSDCLEQISYNKSLLLPHLIISHSLLPHLNITILHEHLSLHLSFEFCIIRWYAAYLHFLLGPTSRGELQIPPKGLLLVTHEPSSVSTTPGPHIRGSTLRAFSLGDKEVDLLLPGTARLRVQLGVNMPAQANRKLIEDEVDSAEIELFEVYDVVLYMGIIDILQEYNLKKKIEHAYKSLWYDPLSISVIEPKLYAKRFISFLERVFPANAEGYQ
ncbi:phosphatidylinositol 4-phosphate 5-kinase 7-like [Eucalyptus grandis]|uniref:phosphatidylinositol 4-phosphate 5-kinase 7-like n=1 Tax=Eucalyptus grandis TaxID=71139 RepID=UPI00192E7694|nr:phosphatidylinositol 4-phosphate 5-kinase 7-like [Eucalyptus grandis]